MHISIKSIEDSLNLKKSKSPLIHCISNLFTINNLEKVIFAYDGIPLIARNEDEVEDITFKSNGLLITLDNLNSTKYQVIDKAIRIAFVKKIPIILDITGVEISFLQKETARKLLNRYDINVVVGTIEELNYLLEEEYLSEQMIENIKDSVKIRKRIRYFCKRYRTVVLLEIDRYYLTDGFSEFYIGILTNKLNNYRYLLPGLVAVGIASSKEKETRFKGILIATMVMSVVNKEFDTLEKEEIYLEDILDEIKNISPKKINKLSNIEYNFSR